MKRILCSTWEYVHSWSNIVACISSPNPNLVMKMIDIFQSCRFFNNFDYIDHLTVENNTFKFNLFHLKIPFTGFLWNVGYIILQYRRNAVFNIIRFDSPSCSSNRMKTVTSSVSVQTLTAHPAKEHLFLCMETQRAAVDVRVCLVVGSE